MNNGYDGGQRPMHAQENPPIKLKRKEQFLNHLRKLNLIERSSSLRSKSSNHTNAPTVPALHETPGRGHAAQWPKHHVYESPPERSSDSGNSQVAPLHDGHTLADSWPPFRNQDDDNLEIIPQPIDDFGGGLMAKIARAQYYSPPPSPRLRALSSVPRTPELPEEPDYSIHNAEAGMKTMPSSHSTSGPSGSSKESGERVGVYNAKVKAIPLGKSSRSTKFKLQLPPLHTGTDLPLPFPSPRHSSPSSPRHPNRSEDIPPIEVTPASSPTRTRSVSSLGLPDSITWPTREVYHDDPIAVTKSYGHPSTYGQGPLANHKFQRHISQPPPSVQHWRRPASPKPASTAVSDYTPHGFQYESIPDPVRRNYRAPQYEHRRHPTRLD